MLQLVTAASLLSALCWMAAAALTANRGLDFTDEGFYLLSYRWWDTELRTFTGAQFIYGPVFELLGRDIPGLRLVRLGSIVVSNLLFGWAFMRWLRQHRPKAPLTRWWEAAGAAAILACGGMSYSWLPLSPGYNDLSLLGALLAAAAVLRMAKDLEYGGRPPIWIALCLGSIAFATLLAKWASSGLTLIAVTAVAVVLLIPHGLAQVARITAYALSGLLITAILFQLLIVRLDEAVPLMLETNRLVAKGANAPSNLFLNYLITFAELAHRTASTHAALLVTVIGAVLFRDRGISNVMVALAAPAAGVSLLALIAERGLTGGNDNVRTYSEALMLVLTVTLVVALGAWLQRRRALGAASPRRTRTRVMPIVLLLLVLPLTQAAGTGNPLYFMAFNGFSAWMALVVIVVTGLESSAGPGRLLSVGAACGAVIASVAIGTSALLLHPYRTSPPAESTVVPADVPALRSVALAPEPAARASQLLRLVRPYLSSAPGTYIMAFDVMPGLVFALNGRSVGEAWYSDIDRTRTAAGIRAACSTGAGPWASHPPILLFNRSVSRSEIDALKACGLAFDRDYRRVDDPTGIVGIAVYVVASGSTAQGTGDR